MGNQQSTSETDERAAQARSNRERMPETAREIDGWRAVFGPGCMIIWARENGIEVGTPSPEGVPASVARPSKKGL